MDTSLLQKGYDFTMPPEARAYHHLRTIQGIYIPVYIESANLLLPFHHSSADPCAFFFRVLPACLCSEWSTTKKTNRVSYRRLIKPWGAIHRLRVLRCDARYRNIMIDEKSGRVHIVGFERAKILPKKQKGLMKKMLSLSTKRDSRAMEIRIDFLSTKELRRALADMAFDLRTIC